MLVGLFYGSFVLAHHWIRAGRTSSIVRTCVIVAVLLVVYCVVTYERSFVVATYERWKVLEEEGLRFGDIFEWKGWQGAAFLGHQVFWANLVIAFIDLGPLVYLYYRFSRHRR